MFSTICQTLENVITITSKKEKLLELSEYYQKICHTPGIEVYDSFRLILPKFDKARSSYGVKENALAKKYIESLCISKTSIEAQRLLKFKAVKGTKDLPDTLFHILKNRCHGMKDFTIKEINCLLDSAQLGCAKHNEKINDLINNITKNMPPMHQKWLCRMILKELHLGISEKAILMTIDSNAEAAFNVCSDLRLICQNLGNLSSLCGDIVLGRVFKPMLADRVTDLNNIERLMKNKPFCVETKYDGERMQIHKTNDEYFYYSRGSLEYSEKYGKHSSSGTLTPHIHNNISAKNCILDGEIIVFDLLNNTLITKAQGLDARNLKDNEDPRFLPCFVAYDVVYHDDVSLTMTPFSERRVILEKVVKEKKGYLYLSKHSICSTQAEVLNELNNAIENGDEGLVLKIPKSIYSPDQRVDGGWFKIKTDYLDLMNDTIDVIILGGYHGKNSGSGNICHFLCGLQTSEGNYSSFCKVSSGLTKEDLTQRLSKLDPYWIPFQNHKVPSNITLSPSCREKPAVVIDPCHSLVLEVKGAELMGTNFFALPLTVRFPRVVRVRDDKSPSDCTRFSELENMAAVNKRGVAKVESDAISPRKRPRIASSMAPGSSSSKPADTIVIKSTTLSGKEFCILSGSDDVTKHDAEKCIKQHSGTIVSTPIQGCTVVCGRQSISVQNVIKQGKHLVLDISWISLCSSSVNPCPPHLVLHCPDQLKDEVFGTFDEYGDSYTVPVSPEELKDLFDRLPDLSSRGDYSVNQKAYIDLKKKYIQFSDFWRFALKEMVIFSSDLAMPVLSIAKLYGARITDNENEEGITHYMVESTTRFQTGVGLTKLQLLELLKPHISEESYNAFE